MKNLWIVLLVAGVFIFSSCEKVELNPVSQDVPELKSEKKVANFRAHLSGRNEVPPVETEATGEAIFRLNKDSSELSYKLIVSNIENVRMSHIHLASEVETGPIVVWLYPSVPPAALISGRFNGILAEGVITDSSLTGPLAGMALSDLIHEFYLGNAYVNVHTNQVGSGEIRGQIFGNMPTNH